MANVLLGGGVPTFDPGLTQRWQLLGHKLLPGSDIVALHFDCRPL